MRKRKRYLIIIFGILFISILGTFAWLAWKSKDTSLVLTIGDMEGTTVTLKPYMVKETLIPTLTYEGNESINVTAKNNGTTENDIVLYYKINDIDEELITDSFKYTVLKSTDGVTYEEYQIGNFSTVDTSKDLVIMSETVPANTTYNYKVYTWLDGENETSSNIQGKSFKAELRANIYNGSIVTVDVPDGLIPVTIANDGTVTSILETDSNWYDYNNKLWANGVLVTESSRSTYLGTTGVTIPESDILAYYVYIPRYKYKIWTTGTSSKGSEQEIDIVFENVDISKSKGTKVGDYLTHPGFTFGGVELNGIWIGKFEISADTTSVCYTDSSIANCNNINQEPRIKPNVSSLRNQDVSTQFQTSLKFSGGVLDNGIVSFSGSNVYGLGSEVDTHMTKNIEWAAAAYLSHSKYGIKTEIRLNNNNDYLTGCGAVSVAAASSDACDISYGNSSDYPQSTTGNITGIFDMSGGAWEKIMGVFTNSDGTLWSGGSSYDSGFNGLLGEDGTEKTNGISFPESKYYDAYKASSGTTINVLTACNSGYCYGHGLSEISGWYAEHAYFVYAKKPWFGRGGSKSDENIAAVFEFSRSMGGADNSHGFRSALIAKPKVKIDIVTDGLQVYYDGNNNTGYGHDKDSTTWIDLSGNGNNGTINGSVWGSNYLSFDGTDDWVAIKEMNYDNFTIEVIAMPTIINSGEMCLVCNYNSGGYGVMIYDNYAYSQAYITDNGWSQAIHPELANVNQMYHYAGTYDGNNLKLYQDGILVTTTSISGVIKSPTKNTIMALGTNPSGSNSVTSFFSGKMYMVRIYDRALSSDEIRYNYKQDKEKYSTSLADDEYVITNLQLYYDGIDNSGSGHNTSTTTWIDLSGNGNNGTINGATWGSNYLSFDGTDDWVAIGEMNYDKFTLEVIAMTTTTPTGTNSLIGNWHFGGYGLAITSGRYARVNGYFTDTWIDLKATTKSNINQLYHYVGTYDGTNLKIYQDGTLSNSTTTDGALITTTQSTIMALGVNPTGSSSEKNFFAGNIYSVRIYNRALTDEEILHNYNVDKNRFNLN